jgi:chromosome segregation ATPase
MGLLSAVRQAFDRRASLRDELDTLEKRVRELEDLQVKRETDWQQAREAIYRQVQRMAAVEQRRDARLAKENGEDEGARPNPARVLAAKFRTGG